MRVQNLIPWLGALLLGACTAAPALQPEPKAELTSPDGQLRMSFCLSEAGTPFYTLSRGDTPVLTPSRLGFTLRGVVKAEDLTYAADGSIGKRDREGRIAFDHGHGQF